MHKIRDQNRKSQEELSHRLAAKSSQQSSAEKDIRNKEAEADQLLSLLSSLRTEMQKLNVTDADLESLKSKVEEAERNLNSQVDTAHDESKLSFLENDVKEMEADKQKKRELLRSLNAKFEKVILIQQKSKELAELQQQIEQKFLSEKDNIHRALKALPELDELRNSIDVHVEVCAKKEQESLVELQAVQARYTESKMLVDRLKAELDDIQKSLLAEQKIMTACESKEVVLDVKRNKVAWQVAIDNVEKDIKDETRLNLAMENMGDLLDNYCKTAETRGGCPLCERPFQKVSVRVSLTLKLNR